MIRSLYTAATGMLVQRKKMDVVINNVANIETTGYKKDKLLSRSFRDMLIERTGTPSAAGLNAVIGPLNAGVHIDEVYTDFTQGSLDQTDIPTDLALQGGGYFVISTGNGIQYTRDGSFSVDGSGYLVTGDGNYVMGTSGGIYVGADDFIVDAKGNITVNGTAMGSLKIAAFADNSSLEKAGNNLYTGQETIAAKDTIVKQGYLEASNVDIADQMVEMLQINRTYDTNQRIIKMLDETLGKAVNELGKV
ncbi:MAG: flagellar basal-body rod protein FlgF [Christensenellales bacterium]